MIQTTSYASATLLCACGLLTPLLHHIPTRLLQQLTLHVCWPPSWVVGVTGLGPAARLYGRISKSGQLYAGCIPLAPLQQKICLVPDHCFGLAVLLGHAMIYLRDLCCAGSSTFPFYCVDGRTVPFCPDSN